MPLVSLLGDESSSAAEPREEGGISAADDTMMHISTPKRETARILAQVCTQAIQLATLKKCVNTYL